MTIKDVLKNSFLLRPLSNIPLMPQMWSLVIEMNFSLWMPFFIIIARQSILGLQAFTIVGLCFASMFGNHKFVVMFTLGITLAYFYKQIPSWLKFTWIKTFCFIVGLCLYSINHSQSGTFSFLAPFLKTEHIPYFVAVGSFLLLLWILATPTIQKILELKPLIFLGKISYSFYLLHFGILISFSPYIVRTINQLGINESDQVRVIAFLISAAVAIFLSWVFYEIVEKFCINLSRKVRWRNNT